jgi:hypothetical protein
MIPILGVPVLNRPDLLDEMLATIDTDIGRLIIIDNGGVVTRTDYEVHRPERNLGVAGSWNHILRIDAPWWAIVNFDLTFGSGDLDHLASFMDEQTGPMVALLGTFSAFGINRQAIELAGYFDENFHPAYFEDNDFDYRCRMTGVDMKNLPSGLLHRTSSTIGSSPVYSRENARTFPYNARYYMDKWGGSPRHERFTTPFDSGVSPKHWEIDQARLDRLVWDRS